MADYWLHNLEFIICSWVTGRLSNRNFFPLKLSDITGEEIESGYKGQLISKAIFGQLTSPKK